MNNFATSSQTFWFRPLSRMTRKVLSCTGMKSTAMALGLLSAAVWAVGVQGVGGSPYHAYSYFPEMGHSSDSAANGVSDSVFVEHASVTDMDQWQRASDNSIVEFGNPATSITPTIRSGRLIATNFNYDSGSGTNAGTFTIVASHTDGTAQFLDDFQGADNSVVNTDPAPSKNTCVATISASSGTGGTGGTSGGAGGTTSGSGGS